MSFRISVDASGPDIDLADETLEIKCPECGTANMVTFGQVRDQEKVTCIGCGITLKLADEGRSMARAIDDVNSAFDELKNALEGLGD